MPPFGMFLDAVMQLPKNMHAEEMQDDAQNFNEMEAARAREFNSAQALAQRDWQERMSNTAHQRSINDLSRAGLNPILAARHGGAVTGGAAAASGPAASSGGAVTAGPAGTNFTQGQMNAAMSSLMAKQEKVQEGTEKNLEADTAKKWAERSLASQHYNESQARTGLVNHQASIAGNSAKGFDLEGEIDSTTYGKIMRYIDRSIRAITGAGSAHRNLRE